MKRFLTAILILSMMLSLVCCTKGEDAETEGTTTDSSPNEIESSEKVTDEDTEKDTDSDIETEIEVNKVIAPENGAVIVLANDEVYGWWEKYNYGKTDSSPFYRHEDIYYPNSVSFSWDVDEKADYYKLLISRDKDFAPSETESYLVNTASLTLSHLFTGTEYYWKVLGAEITDDGERLYSVVDTVSFTTAESPRCLEVEGVSNTRDIGGLKTLDGKRIKQGMIYRGGKLEGITEEGKEFFLNYLNIQTDLDLRTPGEGGAGSGSPLGNDINYVNFNGRYYVGGMGINTEDGKKVFADEIRVFANPDNYPIYIHCSLGRDRTGTLAFVIEALLGVSKNNLIMDYELSVFSVGGTLDNASIQAIKNNIFATYDYISQNFEGSSLAEKTENYLLSIGITEYEIETIRNLLLEEVK